MWVMEEHEGGHSIGPIFLGGGWIRLDANVAKVFLFFRDLLENE